MGQASAVVVARVGEKNLAFVLQAAKGAGMDDAIAVALKRGSVGMWGFRVLPGAICLPALHGKWRQVVFLQPLAVFPAADIELNLLHNGMGFN